MTLDTDPNTSNMTSAEHMTASFAVLELGVDASLEPTTAVTPTNLFFFSGMGNKVSEPRPRIESTQL